jgi:CheY-like chemotaxis protein/anti-sigma regulatory factor (Ser/Thr protein kinase)
MQNSLELTKEEKELLLDIYHSREGDLRQVVKKIVDTVAPRVKFFQEYGISKKRAEEIFLKVARAVFTQDEDYFLSFAFHHFRYIKTGEHFRAFMTVLSYFIIYMVEFLVKNESDILRQARTKILMRFICKSLEGLTIYKFVHYNALLDFQNNIYYFLNSIIDDLNNALEIQQQFLSSISHEIRTPLNAILGYLELMNADDRLPVRYKEMVKVALKNSDILLRLINDLLDASKLRAGQMDINDEEFDLFKQVADVLKLFKSYVNEDVDLKWELDYCPFKVKGDHDRIKQILSNLLSNAFKFTERGLVYLTMRFQPGENDKLAEIYFSVTDTGTGIPVDRQKEIFQPFRQIRTSARGTGLGLYIAREFARKMNGDVWFKTRPGEGTTFYVKLSLPLGNKIVYQDLKGRKVAILSRNNPCLNTIKSFLQTNGAEVNIFDNLEQFKFFLQKYNHKTDDHIYVFIFYSFLTEKNNYDMLKTNLSISHDTTQYSLYKILVYDLYRKRLENASFYDDIVTIPFDFEQVRKLLLKTETKINNSTNKIHKTNILVIDDIKTNCQVAKLSIEKIVQGASVDIALSGKEGIALLQQKQYDMIFLDIKMPEMDGYETVKHIRRLGYSIPVIALSADAYKSSIEKAMRCGFDEYLTKPFKWDDMRKIILKFMEK